MRSRSLTAITAVVLVTVTLVTLLPLGSLAHTRSQLDTWQSDWIVQAVTTDLTVSLMAEHQSMVSRHHWYFYPPRRQIATTARIRPAVSPVTWPESVERWRPLVTAYFHPEDVGLVLCLIAKESGGNPNADNPQSSASGLMQHLYRLWPDRSVAAGWPGASIWDPEANIAVGAWLAYEGGGWGHWVTYESCR